MAGLTIDFERIAQFALPRTGVKLCAGMRGLGYERDGKVVAAFLLEGFDGPNIWAHAAFGTHGVPRTLLTALLRYVYIDLGCKRMWARICATNAASRHFVERLGAHCVAVLPQADGEHDVCIYRLLQQDVRAVFIEGRGNHHG